MNHSEILKEIGNKDFLDKLYGFAYKRCNSSHMAEDLCSDIILAILVSVRKNPEIENLYAYVWTIAHRVYADFCKKRKDECSHQTSDDSAENKLYYAENPIEDFIEKEDEKSQLAKIMREITFLSKIYRDVMVMYYLDEIKPPDIANRLNISENAVKQRLFSARNTIRNEEKKMDRNYTLKPVDIAFIGTGNPVGNDPRTKAERLLSKNVVYLCKNTALSAKEISEKLNVPMPFIEDELEIQLHGENGTYGLLRKDGNKYISNFLILDPDELSAGTDAYKKYLPEFCRGLKQTLISSKEKILAFPFLSKQDNVNFIAWSLISSTVWDLDKEVRNNLKDKCFSDIETTSREFTTIGLAHGNNEPLNIGFYGCDGVKSGIGANNICGYSSVFVSNVYGERVDAHFHCGHNISNDPLLMLTIKSIGGLEIDILSDDEKEAAAKAIECGYVRKDGNILTPKIIVLPSDKLTDFYSLLSDFTPIIKNLSEKIADELSSHIEKYVPKHLMNEYPMYSMAASIRILYDTIEKCVEDGILTTPENRLCAEGVIMGVQK